jgi:hypothetical protein
MMNNTLDFNSFNDVGEEEDSNLFEDQLQPDYKYVAGQIKQLAEIRDSLRGPPMGADGSPATREEVATWYKLTLANQL